MSKLITRSAETCQRTPLSALPPCDPGPTWLALPCPILGALPLLCFALPCLLCLPALPLPCPNKDHTRPGQALTDTCESHRASGTDPIKEPLIQLPFNLTRITAFAPSELSLVHINPHLPTL